MRAYRLGLLNQKYNYPYSLARELIIFNELERELITDVVRSGLALDSQLISFGKKESINAAYGQLDKIVELTLPYLNKKDTINKDLLKPVTSEADFDALRAVIAERKKKEAEAKKIKNELPVQPT